MSFNKLVNHYKQDIIKSTQDLIRIKSVEEEPEKGMPFGKGPYEALNYVLKLAEGMGFDAKNLDGYVGCIDFGDNNDDMVGVLTHVDVVPAGDGWTFPPYDAQIQDGRIYGRGSLDDKGPTIATLYSLKALKEAKVSLNKKIRIILGANEETDWRCIKYYTKHEDIPNMAFTPDANFPVIYGEKGTVNFKLIMKNIGCLCNGIKIVKLDGGTAVNTVPDYCEAILEVEDIDFVEKQLKTFKGKTKYNLSIEKKENTVKIKSKGISAHACNPHKGQNAITQLLLFLEKLTDRESYMHEFIRFYDEKIAFKHNGEGIGCNFEDEISGKLTLNPGVITKKNNDIILSFDLRYPIKFKSEDIYIKIERELKGTNIELVKGDNEKKPLYVPKDSPIVKKLMKVYKEVTGDKESEPITIGGITYARAFDNTVAFGPVMPGEEELAHQKDEYIEIEHLILLTKIYAKALYELAR